MQALNIKNISMHFGGLKAVDQLSFSIQTGGLFGLIGPNGAGKTTVFNMITGVYKPTIGQIEFFGKDITGMKSYEIAQLGMTRTFQNIRLFKELTVLQNILIAGHKDIKYSMLGAIFKTEKYFEQEKVLLEKAKHILSYFKLDHKLNEEAGSLPYGEQRKLEVVRALATNPKLICLDEPAAGMNDAETHQLMQTIDLIRKDFNLTVLLIEHDMKLVMGICENIIVLDHGTKIDEGNAARIKNSKSVIEAYLGVDMD